MGITVASVAVTLIGMLYPEDKNGVRKALELCLSLCLLCAVIAPIAGMISDARDEIDLGGLNIELPEIDASADSAVFAAIAEESSVLISQRLGELIRTEFSLNEEHAEVSVSVAASEGGVIIERVTVWLHGKGVLTDPREIKLFVAEYTDAECEIVNGGKE